jgi:hypothetical protein
MGPKPGMTARANLRSKPETQQMQQAYTCAYARAEKTIRPECSPMFAVMALILLLTRESDPGHGGERVNAIAHG